MRLAEGHGVVREDFLKNYWGFELDPRWLNRVSKLSAKGWKSLIARDKDKVKQLRQEIQTLAGETGLEIGEFRRIVHMVQKREREARLDRFFASNEKRISWRWRSPAAGSPPPSPSWPGARYYLDRGPSPRRGPRASQQSEVSATTQKPEGGAPLRTAAHSQRIAPTPS